MCVCVCVCVCLCVCVLAPLDTFVLALASVTFSGSGARRVTERVRKISGVAFPLVSNGHKREKGDLFSI